jgi:hypothetical protein
MNKSLLDYTLKIRVPLVLFVAAASFTITFFISRAERDSVGYAPVQPIAFSHKLHAGLMAIDCQYCHTSAAVSRSAGVPPVSICMGCHAVARKDKPEIVKLTKAYESGASIRWKRIHRVPDFVYFNHSAHVNRHIQCQTCHGRVQDMDVVEQVSKFTMGACLECHRNAPALLPEIPGIKRGPDNCNTCHR